MVATLSDSQLEGQPALRCCVDLLKRRLAWLVMGRSFVRRYPCPTLHGAFRESRRSVCFEGMDVVDNDYFVSSSARAAAAGRSGWHFGQRTMPCRQRYVLSVWPSIASSGRRTCQACFSAFAHYLAQGQARAGDLKFGPRRRWPAPR